MKNKKNNFNASPLPFMGQKRNFANKFKAELQQFDNELIFVDLFGGSCLLSHITKQEKPNSRVICNDFDSFHLRIKSIERTKEIIDFAKSVLPDVKKNDRVNDADKATILKFIKQKQDEYGYIDYITLSSQLLFSGNYVQSFSELEKGTWYAKLRKSDFDVTGYLEGVETVCMDYRDLYNKYKNNPKVVFIIDPPYMQTQSNGYKNTWRLQEHLDCLNVLDARRFFYFTSSKSSIIELFDWMDSNEIKTSPFSCCKKVSHTQHITHNSSYEDIMFVKS